MADGEPQLEYLSEWPPREPVRSKRSAFEDECHLKKKKIRCTVDETISDRDLTSEEKEIAERSPSVPIVTLLAQWWKLIRRSSKSSCASKHDSFPHFNSAYTLLHHICEYECMIYCTFMYIHNYTRYNIIYYYSAADYQRQDIFFNSELNTWRLSRQSLGHSMLSLPHTINYNTMTQHLALLKGPWRETPVIKR